MSIVVDCVEKSEDIQLILKASLPELVFAADESGAKCVPRLADGNAGLVDHGLIGADADGTLLIA